MASGAAQALLHVVWGALSPPGAGRWYFLLALRLLALTFARGAWRGPPHDLLCTWTPPGPLSPPPSPGLRRLCAALCYNRHFPAPMATLWSLSFLLALLPITLLRLLHPPGHARRGAEGGDDPNVAAEHDDTAAGHANMAASRANMAAGHANMAARRSDMAAGHDGQGGSEGSSGEDRMAARHSHKMAAGRRACGKNKMAAWPHPGDESSALMWMDELDAAARPRPSHESNMAARHHPMGKSKMAAWHHPANESSVASWTGESKMAARCCPPAQSKMAARHGLPGESNMAACLHPPARSKMAAVRCLPDIGDVAPWSDEPRPPAPPCPPAGSNMAAGHGPAAGSNMAARRRPTPGANMAASPSPPSPSPSLPALPALPTPSGHDGRSRWRVWLGAGAAAMLAVGEGGFLWAVLWRQLPAVTAVPIGCHLPATAPCPPLACALPARADKMAALLGIAASAAVSLIAVMAAAVTATVRALRGRSREGEGPV